MSLTHILLYKSLGLFLSLPLLSLSELIQSSLIKEDLWTWHWIKAERINSSHIEFSPLLRGPQLRRSLGTATFHNRQNSWLEDTQYFTKKGSLIRNGVETFRLCWISNASWLEKGITCTPGAYLHMCNTGIICAPTSHPFTLCHNKTRGWCKPQQQI